MIRPFVIIVCCLFHIISAFGQITLEECWEKAEKNYPLAAQYGLIEKTKEYNLSNAGKGYLPQISLSGKASYQSDVTELPFSLPEIGPLKLSKDQYQIMAEIRQNIWDGGEIHYQKQQTEAVSNEAYEQLNVKMYALHERITQLFFGILLLNEQLEQNRLLQEDLQRSLQNVAAYCENGLAGEADIDAVRVELLHARQQHISLSATRESYVHILSLFTGDTLQAEELVKPAPIRFSGRNIERPELQLYHAQEDRITVQQKMLKTSYMPRLSLFAQGAYGNPGLNMLKNTFEPYYIVGIRLGWNFGSLYTLRNNRLRLETEQEQVRNNMETFLFDTRLQMIEQDAAILSLQEQMREDDEIIRLRTNIRKAAEAKVANGTLSVTEMLSEITKENQARQTRTIHEIRLLMDMYKLKQITNHP